MPIKLISTDFDGTIFAEFAEPPVALALQNLLGNLQRQGAFWVINTGRDLGSLVDSLNRAELAVQPDALVLVEREIYVRQEGQYHPVAHWNEACTRSHAALFERVAPDLAALADDLRFRHRARFYEDAFSPLCVIAENPAGAEAIHAELKAFAREVPQLEIVRNDVYIRLAHADYNKGTALSEIARRLKLGPAEIVAAGDHYNDLTMLEPERARWLVAPANAIPDVQEKVRRLGGYVSHRPYGEGVALGLEYFLERA